MAALISSVRRTVGETAVGLFHSYLWCGALSFFLCLALLPSPPSSSDGVAGTLSDSEALAPSRVGAAFHSAIRSPRTAIAPQPQPVSCYFLFLLFFFFSPGFVSTMSSSFLFVPYFLPQWLGGSRTPDPSTLNPLALTSTWA